MTDLHLDPPPPGLADRVLLARLYLACIGRLAPSERRDRGLAPLLDQIGLHLGVRLDDDDR